MNNQPFGTTHFYDENGNPAGGAAGSQGVLIHWQDGPLVDPETGERKEPNGAFVETVLRIAIDRMRFYQGEASGELPDGTATFNDKFKCRENALAITHMEEALHWLNHRTANREARGVEGTHQQ